MALAVVVPPAVASEEPLALDLAILAIDPVAERVVVRVPGQRPTVATKGGRLADMPLRVVAVWADRIEVETVGSGKASRYWLMANGRGQAQAIALERRPPARDFGDSPAHGGALGEPGR